MKYITPYSNVITENNQEWSEDDSGNNIITKGVTTKTTGVKFSGNKTYTLNTDTMYVSPGLKPEGITWDGNNLWSVSVEESKIYKHNADMTVNTTYTSPTRLSGLTWDGNNLWTCDAATAKIHKHNADFTIHTSYSSHGWKPTGLAWDGNNLWGCDNGLDKIYKYNADINMIATYSPPHAQPSGLTWDGNNLWSCDTSSHKIYKHNDDMTVNAIYNSPDLVPIGLAWDGNTLWVSTNYSSAIFKLNFQNRDNINVDIYNTANTSAKCRVGNSIPYAATYQINEDGTGTINYDESFSESNWLADSNHINATGDLINSKVNIFFNGYVAYAINTQYPIIGVPTLTSQYTITEGIPTIQISADGDTWYNIDTTIVDDILTVYNLDCTSLHLNDLTILYFRFECDGLTEGAVKSFQLNVNIDTTTAQNPLIYYNTGNTFRCDQDIGSGITGIAGIVTEDDILQPITIY